MHNDLNEALRQGAKIVNHVLLHREEVGHIVVEIPDGSFAKKGDRVFVTGNDQYYLYHGEVVSNYSISKLDQIVAVVDGENLRFVNQDKRIMLRSEILYQEGRLAISQMIESDECVGTDYYDLHSVSIASFELNYILTSEVVIYGTLGEIKKALRL
jgi:hypothetical protein